MIRLHFDREAIEALKKAVATGCERIIAAATSGNGFYLSVTPMGGVASYSWYGSAAKHDAMVLCRVRYLKPGLAIDRWASGVLSEHTMVLIRETVAANNHTKTLRCDPF